MLKFQMSFTKMPLILQFTTECLWPLKCHFTTFSSYTELIQCEDGVFSLQISEINVMLGVLRHFNQYFMSDSEMKSGKNEKWAIWSGKTK